MKTTMKVGDLVRIKQSSGRLSDQRYKLTKVGPRFACEMVPWPEGNDRKMRTELFDTDLLVVDNSGPALLAAQFGRRR